MSGIDRKEILRRDCPECKTKCFIIVNGEEQVCTLCSGYGVIEKEVPYKFDGPRDTEEIDAIFAE